MLNTARTSSLDKSSSNKRFLPYDVYVTRSYRYSTDLTGALRLYEFNDFGSSFTD